MADFLNSILLPENRVDLETLIDAAIARLDAMDGDTDLEDGFDDEPSLGALESSSEFGFGTVWLNPMAGSDLEEQCDDEGSGDQAHWGAQGHVDCQPIKFRSVA